MGPVAGTDHLDRGVHRRTDTRGARGLTPPREPLRVALARLGPERCRLAAGGFLLCLRPGGGARLAARPPDDRAYVGGGDRKSTRLNSSHANISYAVFCLKK